MASPDLVGDYLKEIGKVPLLTAEEEILLGKKIQAWQILSARLTEQTLAEIAQEQNCSVQHLQQIINQGKKAQQKMIRANLRLVVNVAKKYLDRGVDFLDLIQEGNLGLVRATEKFDPTRGYKFSTYAHWWIMQGITRTIAETAHTIRQPIHINEALNRIKKVIREFSVQEGRYPTTKELIQLTKLSPEKVEMALYAQRQRKGISIDKIVGDSDKNALGDFLPSDLTVEPQNDDLHPVLSQCLKGLTAKEKEVLFARILEQETLQKIGDRLGVSRERVRGIQAQALRKIKNKFTPEQQEEILTLLS